MIQATSSGWASMLLQSFFGHLALAVIAEFAGSLRKRQTVGASDFMPHRCRNVIDLAGLILVRKNDTTLNAFTLPAQFAHIGHT